VSVDATRWAWTVTGIKSTDKLVLLSLADRANEEHESWPGIDRLSADCCMKRATVIAAIRRLMERGVIERRKRFGGSPIYTLVGVESRHVKTGTSTETGTNAETGTVSSTETGTAVVPKPAPEPKTEPNNKPNKGKSAAVPAFHAAVIDAYHDTLPDHPRVRAWNTKRQRLLDRSRKEYPKCDDLDWWRRYFEYIAGSDFLCGRARPSEGRRPFIADLEFLVNITSLTKVIEGKYHDGAAA
jgi:predicted transcriptional regulator